MDVTALGEFGLIERLRQLSPTNSAVIKGIGDDTAVLPYSKDKYLLFTTDMMAQGVHFTSHTKPDQIGRKVLACNISDIAAMGGLPTYAVVSISLPKSTKIAFVEGLYKGMRAIAKEFDVSIVGGDTIHSDKITINIALLGEVEKKYLVCRDGAKAGDWIFVTGVLGGSFKSGRHLTFTPRVAQARFLVQRFKPNAMMDISDGLAGDLNHILKASRVGAKLWEDMIPCAVGAGHVRPVQVQSAMSDGEDFELLFTLSQPKTKQLLDWQQKNKQWFFYPIGCITSNPKQRISTKSFSHF